MYTRLIAESNAMTGEDNEKDRRPFLLYDSDMDDERYPRLPDKEKIQLYGTHFSILYFAMAFLWFIDGKLYTYGTLPA